MSFAATEALYGTVNQWISHCTITSNKQIGQKKNKHKDISFIVVFTLNQTEIYIFQISIEIDIVYFCVLDTKVPSLRV